jgi:hypothetical protein
MGLFRRSKPQPSQPPMCFVCKVVPSTQFRTSPPAPGSGSTYRHTSSTCDEHASYLHGHSWSTSGSSGNGYGEAIHIDMGPMESFCCDCHGTYGACGCPRQAQAAFWLNWQKMDVFGRYGEPSA